MNFTDDRMQQLIIHNVPALLAVILMPKLITRLSSSNYSNGRQKLSTVICVAYNCETVKQQVMGFRGVTMQQGGTKGTAELGGLYPAGISSPSQQQPYWCLLSKSLLSQGPNPRPHVYRPTTLLNELYSQPNFFHLLSKLHISHCRERIVFSKLSVQGPGP